MRRIAISGFFLIGIACCSLAANTATTACGPMPQALAKSLKRHVKDAVGPYVAALQDLNGDGTPEALVLLTGTDWCGSGGCTLLVFQQHAHAWRFVSRTTIVRPPIRVLPVHQHGWSSLSVFVAGGGIIPGYTAILPFGKSGYPSNPTVPPAVHARSRVSGTILISSFHCSS